MTILGWVVCVLLIMFVCCAGIFIATNNDVSKRGVAVTVIVCLLLSCIILGGFWFYYNGTARGLRAKKSQESNLNFGINRRIEVYDVTGGLIKSYEGKFDVDYDDNRIIFDEDGKRHIIYYPNGIIFIDEVD